MTGFKYRLDRIKRVCGSGDFERNVGRGVILAFIT
jgi:hypothetical protein